MKIDIKNILFALLSGILLFFAFPPLELSFLSWIAFVPILYVINKNISLKESFIYFYLTGLMFFVLLLYWLCYVTVPGMIILICFLSCFYGVYGFLIKYVLKFSLGIFILPFLWVVLEYVRSWLFTGFPWAMFGFTQYTNIKIIQIADICGVYGVSFLLMFFNVGIIVWFFYKDKRKIYTIFSLIFIILALVYGTYKSNYAYIGAGPKIGIIQGNIPQKDKWDDSFAESILQKHISLTKNLSNKDIDLIIWPETSYPYLVEKNSTIDEIGDLSLELKSPILLGLVYKDGANYYNSAALINSDGIINQIYHKIHLVPFGEYLPFNKYFSFIRKFVNKPIGDFNKGKDFYNFSLKSFTKKEKNNAIVKKIDFYKFGVLICFEDVLSYISRKLVKKGAKFLVNITNDAWFLETAAAKQHMQASVFRAIENRVPVIRVANTGISGFIDFNGRILSIVKNNKGKDIFIKGILSREIKLCVLKSFYTKYGDIFVLFSFFMICLIIIVSKKNNYKKN